MAEDTGAGAQMNQPLAVAEGEFAGKILELSERLGLGCQIEHAGRTRAASHLREQLAQLIVQEGVLGMVGGDGHAPPYFQPLVSMLEQVAGKLAVSLLAECEADHIKRAEGKIRRTEQVQMGWKLTGGRAGLLLVIEVQEMAGHQSSLFRGGERELRPADGVAENPLSGGRQRNFQQQLFLRPG